MKNNKTFSHFDSEGKAIMVDISDKENTPMDWEKTEFQNQLQI